MLIEGPRYTKKPHDNIQPVIVLCHVIYARKLFEAHLNRPSSKQRHSPIAPPFIAPRQSLVPARRKLQQRVKATPAVDAFFHEPNLVTSQKSLIE
ncbi:MAG: hypothetical protein ACK56F_06730, partial [bacterium]